MAYEDLKKRVSRLYPPKEGITALLPDWLADGDQPALNEDEKIIRPSGFLAIQKDGSVQWHE